MSLIFSYHPGRPPQKFKWPGRNADWYLRAWFRFDNLIWPWRRKRYYDRYMKSRAWQDIRAKILARDGHSCRVCGDKNYLQVHHVTYDRFGFERLTDLVTLCHECHQDCHGRRF